MSHFNFLILAFSNYFCPLKSDLSGITICPQALVFFHNSAKFGIWGIFK